MTSWWITLPTLFGVAVLALLLVLVAVRGLDRWIFPELSFQRALGENNLAVGVFLAALAFGIFFLVSHAVAGDLHRYDGSFRKYGRYHFGYRYDWRYFKAQGMAESGLDAAVCSPAGACGLMQFMPGTAAAMGLRDRFDARASIRLGIAYDRRLWAEWRAPRPPLDRLRLTFASYNAGLGPVLAAQRRARGAARYGRIAPHLWQEPRTYVARIERWYARFSTPGGDAGR